MEYKVQLASGFDIVAEARRFAAALFGEQLSPDALRKIAADELVALLPVLRRLPRRVDRIGGSWLCSVPNSPMANRPATLWTPAFFSTSLPGTSSGLTGRPGSSRQL